MTHFFLIVHDWLWCHRRLTAASLLVAVGVFIALALRVSYEEDIAKFLPYDEEHAQYEAVYQQIALQDRIVVIVQNRDTARQTPIGSLEEAMDDVAQRLQGKPGVKNLQASNNEDHALELVQWATANAPLLMQPEDYQRIDSILARPHAVAEALDHDRQQLLLPTGAAFAPMMGSDPLHLFTPVVERLTALGRQSKLQTADGYLFSANGRQGLVTLQSSYGASETRLNEGLKATLDTAMAQTERLYPTLELSAVGAPLIAVTNAHQLKTDALTAVVVSGVLILLLLWHHYRRLSYLMWIGVSIAFGWLFALAGMALIKGEVSIIVLGIGSVIIGIAVNYPLHFLDHLRDVGNRRQALAEMVPPLLIGNITTVAAFFCLVWLDAPAMRDLGLFGSLMLVGTILFVLVLLPVLAGIPKQANAEKSQSSGQETAPEENQQPSSESDKISISENHQMPGTPSSAIPQSGKRSLRPVFLTLGIVLTIVLGWFSLQTSFDDDLTHINYMTAQQKRDLGLLSASTREAPLYAVAEGRNLDEALAANDSLQKVLEQAGAGDKISGIAALAPSQTRQREAVDRWNRYWAGGRAEQLKAEVRAEANRLGFAPDAFEPFFELLSVHWQPRSGKALQHALQDFKGSYVLGGNGHKVQIVNYVYTQQPQEVAESVNRSLSSAFAFSHKDIGNQLVEMQNNSFNYIGFVCGFVVFAFLWLSFGKIELALLSFLPLAVSWIWILGAMQIAGVQFNIVNIILASFIFGQGDDYTIFITEGLLYEYSTGRPHLRSYRRSVGMSALLMFIGMGCLVLSRHPALRSLGEVSVIGMMTVVAMAYCLPPLVFGWLTRKHGQRRDLPITLMRLVRTVFSLLVFVLAAWLLMMPFTFIYFHVGKTTEAKKLRYHKLLQAISRWAVRHIPGVSFTLDNTTGEKFDKPAIVVCNHQSHLDLLCLMMLTPKIVFVTNDLVWHNPFYGYIIHHAEFYPVSDGLDKNLQRLSDLYRRGYSICVFPEGTRSADCRILRFYKGAFYLARLLDADILPVFVHGPGHVMPKHDMLLRSGAIYTEIIPRISVKEILGRHPEATALTEDRIVTHEVHDFYKAHYAELCQRLETPEYWQPYEKLRRYYMTAAPKE